MISARKMRSFVGWGLIGYLVIALAGPSGAVGIVLKMTAFSALLIVGVAWLVLIARERRTGSP